MKLFEDTDVLEQLLEKVDQFGRLVAKLAFDYEGAYEPARSIRSVGAELVAALRDLTAAQRDVATALRERP